MNLHFFNLQNYNLNIEFLSLILYLIVFHFIVIAQFFYQLLKLITLLNEASNIIKNFILKVTNASYKKK